MDALTFTAKLVEFLAWPSVAILALCLFQGQLQTILTKLSQLKFGPAEARFEGDATAIFQKVQGIQQEFDPNAPVEDHTLPKVKYIHPLLVSQDPAAAITIARENIEAAIKRTIARENLSHAQNGRASFSTALDALGEASIVSPKIKELILELRDLGDLVTHERVTPTPSSADSYVSAVDRVVHLLLEKQPRY